MSYKTPSNKKHVLKHCTYINEFGVVVRIRDTGKGCSKKFQQLIDRGVFENPFDIYHTECGEYLLSPSY